MTFRDSLKTAGPDLETFLDTAVPRLASLLRFDFCILASVDPASGLETSCEVFGIPEDPAREMQLFELEWFSDDPLKYHELARSTRPAAGLRLTVDPAGVRRYVEIGMPNGVHDELRVSCVVDGTWWATLTGFRFRGNAAFDESDVSKAASLSAPLARGFRQAFLHAAVYEPGDLDRPPGAFSIDAGGRFVTTTATAERWLDSIEPSRMSTLARALVVGVERSGSISLTITGPSGPLSFHAAPTKGADDEISVVVEYPRPVHLTPLVVAAYDLTPRERDVAELVLTGLATKQIARELHISQYTVQDHLKSVFAKTGTGTRGELCAALFTRFYMGPKDSHATPGPYGYFLSG